MLPEKLSEQAKILLTIIRKANTAKGVAITSELFSILCKLMEITDEERDEIAEIIKADPAYGRINDTLRRMSLEG